MTGPVWLNGLGEGKWLGSLEDLIKLYGWDGEGQDRGELRAGADTHALLCVRQPAK